MDQDGGARGTSGAKVVIAMLGSTLVIALLVLAAFVLVDDDNIRCVEGELQDNPVGPDGRFIPRSETFATLEEAEAFVCRHVPHPRETGALSLKEVSVSRFTNLGTLIEGGGGASISFEYAEVVGGPTVFGLQVAFPTQGSPDTDSASEPVVIGGQEGLLVLSPDGAPAAAYWSAGGFDFAAGQQGGGLSLEELLRILESVR